MSTLEMVLFFGVFFLLNFHDLLALYNDNILLLAYNITWFCKARLLL